MFICHKDDDEEHFRRALKEILITKNLALMASKQRETIFHRPDRFGERFGRILRSTKQEWMATAKEKKKGFFLFSNTK
jgi:uncharacterized protein with PIN domain